MKIKENSNLNFFSTDHAPYYIYAPDFTQRSGGIKALHYLCHAINELGYEAYVSTDITNPFLRTPTLDDRTQKRHELANRKPIAVYPEITHGNPFNCDTVCRWILNIPGHLGGPKHYAETDIIFLWDDWAKNGNITGQKLNIPIIDERVFNNDNNPYDNYRSGTCYYANKYIRSGENVSSSIQSTATNLCQNNALSPDDIAEILRKHEVLFCYEPSNIAREAIYCGCDVIYVETPFFLKFNVIDANIPFIKEADLSNTPPPKNAPKALAKYFSEKIEQTKYLINFIETTQESAQRNKKNKPKSPVNQHNQIYQEMLERTLPYNFDDQVSAQRIMESWSKHPCFNIIIELRPGDENLLADTIDTLALQIYSKWQLDVITTISAPDELLDAGFIGWHKIPNEIDRKTITDRVVEQRDGDWLIELPAGARLSSLYLWHQGSACNYFPDALAFFVDDDCHDKEENHHSPRFKPGVNPEALISADLAGPIAVRRDAWIATGGTSKQSGSQWYFKLLGITEKFGWDSVKHIPNILISYPDLFPSNTNSCVSALVQNMQRKEIENEIIPATGKSWCIRHPLKNPSTISIAILSTGQLDLLSRCFKSVIEKTDYPNFEIIIALTYLQRAPDLDTWLNNVEQTNKPKIRIVRTELDGNHATRCNAAAMASSSDFLLFLKEETVVIQEKWLEELVRSGAQPGIGGVAPRMIQPGSAMIENAGSVLGLNGVVGSPYQGKTKLGEDLGYLDSIHVARDVSTLPAACMLIRKESYLKSGGMDEVDLGSHLAEIDLCLKLRRNGERLIYQPLSNIVSSDPKEAKFDLDPTHVASEMLSETHARQVFFERWYPAAAVDPFWNPALSLATNIPTPELEFQARWQTIPSDLPRILAHPLPNGQGDYRVTSPLTALSKAGLASECIWRQRTKGEPRFHSIAEIVRLNPDSVIVQHYTITPALAALQEWSASGCRPFTVYALDDLITDMDATNPFRKDIPANARTRLQYALQRCDRLVVSTDYLADAYRGFIPDIRVVPNRLEQAHWLPLRSHRRTTKKPRIGWAGGTTHQGDLLLLKEIVEQTRDEADWIFFGMCPDEIRPLLAEYHGLVSFSEYPAYLASLNLDLAVAPLSQTAFNRGKSNLRLLDYGILGIPVVCTDIEPYRNSPACCVNNTVAEWTGAIRARIHDPEAREREGDAIRRWVLDGYLLENHLEQWLKAHLPD